MACTSQRSEELGELAAGRLDPDAAARLFDHVETCEACSAELDLVAELVAASAVEAGPRQHAAARRDTFHALGRLIAAAAAVVVVALLWGTLRSERASIAELAQLDPTPAGPTSLRADGTETRAFDDALAAYASGDFARATEGLAAVAADDPRHALAQLYLGIATLQVASPDAAVPALEAAARTGEGLVRERALWYLANAHLAVNDARAARDVLERLVALDGDYRPNAEALLERLATHLER